ncbi:MAG: D-tyrosyl-tRNA(Tyr) deacylase [Proteobacteria bacterium]|nr:MAG: D-tyrosyl-tRNA(Tyr) deacylase [Pseudomonadota bacterium]
MKALIQRVSRAEVVVDGKTVGKIGPGILTLLGVGKTDSLKDAEWLMQKISKLRIFEDEAGKMNRSLLDSSGEHLIVSQFTLYGDTDQGNRPSFINAGPPAHARQLYESAVEISRRLGLKTETGQFQAEMSITLTNEGPVTFMIESPPA